MCLLSTTSKSFINFYSLKLFSQTKQYLHFLLIFPFFTIPGPQPNSPEAQRLMRLAYEAEDRERGERIVRHFDEVMASLPSPNSPY
jgi:hypothetical protein